MKKSTKIWLIVAASLILVGSLILCCVMMGTKGDSMKLNTGNYETNRYTVEEEFSGIKMITDTADIEFVISDVDTTEVTCFEKSKVRHSVSVKDGTLVITSVDTRKWYDHIQLWNFKNPKITVSLPEGEYGALAVEASTGDVKMPKALCFETVDISVSTGDVKCLSSSRGEMKIRTSTGDITAENISAGPLTLSVTTGKVTVTGAACDGDISLTVTTGKAYLTNITCTKLVSSGNTGDLNMVGVIASEEINVRRTTGDVRIEKCDAAEININTDTGDVTGTLLSEKIFITKSSSGNVKVPETASGGKCKVTTNTGDIIIDIVK